MIRRILIALAFVAVCAGLAWLLSDPITRPAHAGVAIEPAVVNLDPTLRGSKDLTVPVTVSNHGRKATRVALKSSCGCSRIEPAALALGPGESRSVEVTLTPPENTAPYTVRLTCVDEKTGEILSQAEFRGQVVPWLTAPVQTVQLAPLGRDGHASSEVAVRNLSAERFAGKVSVDGAATPYVTVEPAALELEPGASATVTVSGAHPGFRRVRGHLEFVADADGKPVHRMDIVVTGGSRYVADPPALLWSADQAPKEPLTLGIARKDGTPFRVVTARLEPQVPWLSVGYQEDREDKHRLTVAVEEPGRGQSYTGTLVVQTDCEDEPQALPVRLVATSPASGE